MSTLLEKIVARTPYVVAEVDGVVRAYAYGSRHRDRAEAECGQQGRDQSLGDHVA